MTKLKNSNWDKTQNVTQLKNSNCDNAQKLKLWQNLKTQIVTTQIKIVIKLKLWQHSKTQIVNISNTQVMTTQNSNWDKAQTVKKLKTQIVTNLKKSNREKTQKLKFWQNSNLNLKKKLLKSLLVRTTWHLDNQRDLHFAILAVFTFCFWL